MAVLGEAVKRSRRAVDVWKEELLAQKVMRSACYHVPELAALRVKTKRQALIKSGNTPTPAMLTETTKGEAASKSSQILSTLLVIERLTTAGCLLGRSNELLAVIRNSHAKD